MRRISRLSLLLVLGLPLLASCAHESVEAEVCAPDNFKAFVARFAEDTLFQERHTADPLRQVRIQNEGFQEPHPVEKDVARSQVKFPLFPPAAERQKFGLEVGPVKPDGKRMTVRVEKPDTDIVEEFFFEHGSCWSLVRYENLTL